METQTANSATTNFIFFAYNYPYNFVKEVWPEEKFGSLTKHFENKFSRCYELHGAKGVMLDFFFELSEDHKDRLLTWIANNYNYKTQ